MASEDDGATIVAEMANGEVVMFMGNKQNLYAMMEVCSVRRFKTRYDLFQKRWLIITILSKQGFRCII